jgi:hypothetical protein
MADMAQNPETVVKVRTRYKKKDARYNKTATVTQVTFVWDISARQMQELALKSAKINWQADKRETGIPTKPQRVNVSTLLGGERGKRRPSDPRKVAERNMSKMSEADQVKFARELMARYGLK